MKKLQEAVLAEDNLAVLKAQRELIVEELVATTEPSEKVKLLSQLTATNREIIRFEGPREQKDAATEAALDAVASVRGLGLGDE